MAEKITETLRLEIETPKAAGGGLAELVKQLELVEGHIDRVNTRLAAGVKIPPGMARPYDQIKKDLEASLKTKGPYGADTLANSLGLDPGMLKTRLEKMKTELKGFRSLSQEFVSLPKAASGIHQALQAEIADLQKARMGLGKLLTPTVQSVQGPTGPVSAAIPGAGIAAKVEGIIQLIIPATQVQASVAGNLAVGPPPGLPGRDPATGHFLPTGGDPSGGAPAKGPSGPPRTPSKKGGGKKGAGLGYAVPQQGGEYSRVRVEAGDEVRETVTRANALGQAVSETWDSVEQAIVRTVKKSSTGDSPVQRFRTLRNLATEEFRKSKAGLKPGDYLGLATLQEKQADQLSKLITADLSDTLGPAQTQRLQAMLSARADTFRAEAWKSRDAHKAAVQASVTKRFEQTTKERIAEVRGQQRLAEEGFRKAQATLPPGDHLGLATLQERHADELVKLAKDATGSNQARRLQGLLNAKANTLRAEAARSRDEHRTVVQTDANRRFEQRKKDQAKEIENERKLSAAEVARRRTILETQYSDTYRSGRGPFFGAMAREEEKRAQRLEAALRTNTLVGRRQRRRVEADIGQARANAGRFSRMANMPNPNDELKPTGNYARLLSGLEGFTPMGFAANLTKVAGWASAVAVLYKTVELATHSLSRFVDIGVETAKLNQVFRGVGGSAQGLTDDILKMASANGRSTEEAMESATEWARLGLTRNQVNEAVRVSMNAGNVAQMRTSETTKQLSSLMHIYGLEVGDLNGVLGMLTSTSLRYNVTLEDLFTGLDRSAGMARAAGMSLGELQGIIGATVGKTGQSGIIVGNTVKSILSQFGNPTIQKYLRGYGIETLTAAGGQKSGSEIMRDLFVRYQSMSTRERQDVTRNVAGRLQASRFVAMMDSYVQAQKLAIDSQLELNRAQEVNAKILNTVRGQLAGVRAEWDRLVVSAGIRFGPNLAEGLRGLKNVMREVNGGGGGGRQPMSEQEQRPEAVAALWKWMEAHPKVGKVRTAVMGPTGLFGGQMLSMRATLEEWLKFTQESPFERGSAKFENEVQKHHGAAMAYAMRGRLFETVASAYPKANRPESVESMVRAAGSEMSPRDAAALNKMVGAKDVGGATGLLREQAKRARQLSSEEVAAGIEAQTKRYAEARATRDQLAEEIKQLQAKGEKQEEIAKKEALLLEIENQMGQLTERKEQDLAYLTEELAQTDQIIARKQEYLNLLEQQKQLMESLNQLSEQGGMGTMGSRLDAQVMSLQQQIGLLETTETRLQRQERDTGDLESTEKRQEVQRELADKRAQLAGMQSPQMQGLASTYDARQIAQQRAEQEAASYRVGFTETEKMLNEEKRLREELGRIQGKALNENEAVRAKEMEIQLWRTQEQIQGRILELARQEKQIRMDAAREFSKGLMLSGPGELLQRFHVATLLQRRQPMGVGEFMAMSPELRKMYYEARGGDAGWMNRWERRQIGGFRPGQPEVSKAQAEYNAALGKVWNAYERDKGNLSMWDPDGTHPHRPSFQEYTLNFANGDDVNGVAAAWNRLKAARSRGGGAAGWTVEGQQGAQAGARGRIGALNNVLGGFAGATANGGPAMPLPLEARAAAAAEQVAFMGKAAVDAGNAMNRLSGAMEAFAQKFDGQPGGKSQAPTLNLNTGFSLGAGN